MTKRPDVDLKITRLLLNVGLMCSWLKRFEESERINRALIAYREDLPHPRTNLALAWICQNRLHEAEQELELVRALYPEHQLGKALLGLVQRESGRSGWQQLPREVIEDGRDEAAGRLARVTLGVDASAVSAGGDSAAPTQISHMQRVYA